MVVGQLEKTCVYLLPGIRQDAVAKQCKIKGTDHLLDEIVQLQREGCGFAGTTFMPDSHNELAKAYYESVAEQLNEYGVSFVKLDAVGPGGGSEYYPYQSPDNRACTRSLGILTIPMQMSGRRYRMEHGSMWTLNPILQGP
ncbi:hypothetical protein G6F68_015360 [Rhizopus microsporus]|nr:hypothetical protein G6F68_015360 [Rhizopus microsporus]